MDEQARVNVSLREGKIEISGSEAFVKEQLDRFQEVIDGKLSSLPAAAPPMDAMPPQQKAVQGAQASADANPYPNVIALEDDGVKILKSIPGSKKADKMVNAALLYLVGLGLKGETSASCADIRELCKHHSCLDSPNFAKAMKGAKQYLILSGTGKNQTAKLTHPGQTKANELAAELNAQ